MFLAVLSEYRRRGIGTAWWPLWADTPCWTARSFPSWRRSGTSPASSTCGWITTPEDERNTVPGSASRAGASCRQPRAEPRNADGPHRPLYRTRTSGLSTPQSGGAARPLLQFLSVCSVRQYRFCWLAEVWVFFFIDFPPFHCWQIESIEYVLWGSLTPQKQNPPEALGVWCLLRSLLRHYRVTEGADSKSKVVWI